MTIATESVATSAPAPEAAAAHPPLDGSTPSLMVPIAEIVPSPLNPRTHFDIAELTDSVRTHGVLMPLLTRPRKGKHEIIEGERRYRAALTAGVLFLEVKSREMSDGDALEVMLLANGQREDLTPLEEAKGYRRLIKENPSKYSLARIADRISRSEKYVADRIRLLDLIAPLQKLLDDERIGVGHAELLAKLKPEDQQRAIHVGDGSRFNHRDDGGLWDRVGQSLDFDGDAVDADPYHGMKPVTVKELEAWIARHVRFDVEHMAKTAPLDYGATAGHVQAAQAQPGRGRKVIAITTDYRVQDDARDPTERVYGVQSWRRADGSTGTTELGNGRKVDSPTCDHSVLGVFAVGPGYGTTLQVCIARDKCKVHFKKEIAEREKNAKLRASGQGAKADKREKKAAETWEAKQKRERAERVKQSAGYRALYPLLVEAVGQSLPAVELPDPAWRFLWACEPGDGFDERAKVPAHEGPARFAALVSRELDQLKPDPQGYNAEWDQKRALALAGVFVPKAAITTLVKRAEDKVKADAKAAAAKSTTAPAKKAAKKTAKKR